MTLAALHLLLKPRTAAEIALLVSTVLTTAPAPAATLEGDRAGSFEFRPGVLVDSDRNVVYIMNTSAGLDAVELRSGSVLWTTSLAQRPLLLVKDTLVAQADPGRQTGMLRLILLDIQNNGRRKAAMDIDLPGKIHASIDDNASSSFRIRAWMTSALLIVSWAYSEWPLAGSRDSSQIQPPGLELSGAAAIDVETGRVDPVSSVGLEPPVPPLPSKLAQLGAAGRLPMPLWPCGEVFASAIRVRNEGAERTVLQRWDSRTGDPLPEVTLFTERYTIRYPSADNRYLLVSRIGPTSTSGENFDWMIFSLATGNRVAQLKQPFPAAWFFLSESLLVHEVQAAAQGVEGDLRVDPKKVRGVDLQSGIERWIWPVRDTVYRGTLPPRNPPSHDSTKPSTTKAPGSTEGGQ
jgi:hypothetical protein